MWKVNLGKAVRNLRFIIKGEKAHEGVWRFVETRLPELQMLSPNVYYNVIELQPDVFTETRSAVHIQYAENYADVIREDVIPTEGLSCQEFEEILKSKIQLGLSLEPPTRGTEALLAEVFEDLKYPDDPLHLKLERQVNDYISDESDPELKRLSNNLLSVKEDFKMRKDSYLKEFISVHGENYTELYSKLSPTSFIDTFLHVQSLHDRHKDLQEKYALRVKMEVESLDDRKIPIEFVEASKTIQVVDDGHGF